MRKIAILISALVLSAGTLILTADWNVLSQQTRKDSFDVRVYNVDDVATVYVNDLEVGRVTYTNTAVFDITRYLVNGRNRIRFVVHNYDESYTYGFELLRNGEVMSSFECGRLNDRGCNNDFQKGVVFDRTITVDYTRPAVANNFYNAINYGGQPVSNRVVVTNAMANAMRIAGLAANRAATPSYAPTALTDIRKVDFKNFAYSGRCEPWDTSHALQDGRAQYGESDLDVADLKAVKYLDFDGDKRLEAFVTVEWTTSGSAGGGMNAYVYGIRNGSLQKIWSKCNERSGFVLTGKSIRYNYPEYVGDDAHCCPTFLTTETYAWRGSGIVRIAKKRKRSGY